MKTILAVMLTFTIGAVVLPSVAAAGPCDHSYQSAKDGSNCGERAADQRQGGR